MKQNGRVHPVSIYSEWMKMFNTSNQGAEFNQAKMGPVDKPKKEGAES